MSFLSFNEEQIIEFINECLIANIDEFNLSNYEFIDPIYWVILKAIKQKLRPNLKVIIDRNSPAYSYFLYLFNVEDKKAKTTVPIREIQSRGEVEKFVNELLSVINLDFEDWADKGAFKYPLIELTNNAIDHGRSLAITCAQKFPIQNEMEITVADCGVGFLRTIGNKFPEIKTHDLAIKKALEKGVTGSLMEIYSTVTKNIGMGLYVVSQMIHRVKGEMFIVSGDSFYSFKNDKSRKLKKEWQGSIVTLRFNLYEFQKNILDYGFTLIRDLLISDEDGEGEDVF